MTLITTAAFHTAVASGNLEPIQTFFRHPTVRPNIDETEALILRLPETPRIDITQLTLRDGTLPWFRTLSTWIRDEDAVPLVDAARRGAVDVIAWVFSCENARRMGATLMQLFPLVALFRRRRYSGEQNRWVWTRPSARDPLVLEALLTSHVFCELFSDEQKQSLLDMIANQTDNPAMLTVAMAHGAQLYSAASVVAFYGVEALRTDMSFLVAADVLITPSCFWKHADADDSFLLNSATTPLTRALIDSATAFNHETFEAALTDGFVDVDARDVEGATSLMRWAVFNTSDPHYSFHYAFTGTDPPKRMAEMLLDAGADLTLVDNNGRSALHHARNNESVTSLLLARGADPTLRDADGVMAFDWIVEKVFEWTDWRDMLSCCLARGADPFRQRPLRLWDPDADDDAPPPQSLYERLCACDAGREFISAHVNCFRHCRLPQ